MVAHEVIYPVCGLFIVELSKTGLSCLINTKQAENSIYTDINFSRSCQYSVIEIFLILYNFVSYLEER